MTKKVLPVAIALIAIGSGAFFGGMKYAESKKPSGNTRQVNSQNLQNLSPEERQQRFQQIDNGAAGRARNGQVGANATSGEILSKDDKSVTIKLRDGGSLIVFFSDLTEITKSVNGSASDLEIGQNVSIGGQKNSDGRITASAIQLRPNSFPFSSSSPVPPNN